MLRASGIIFDNFGNVPRNRLALAVGVGRKIDIISFLCGSLNLRDDFTLFGGNNVARDKTAFDINGVFVGLRQVAHVPDRGKNGVVLAEIVSYCSRFCRRFNDK